MLVAAGNLRCNMIFHPSVCLTMLRQHRTKEGESHVRMVELPVEVPTVMGGSITITHQIDSDSPLADAIVNGVVSPDVVEEYAFSVTIVANDDIYNAEVNAMKRYTMKDFAFDKRFADVMVLDGESKSGEPPRFKVDFERFHEIRDMPTAAEREALTPSRASPGAKVDVNMCL